LRKKLAACARADLIILPLANFAAVETDCLIKAAARCDLGAVGL
jgi:hypothetical protein